MARESRSCFTELVVGVAALALAFFLFIVFTGDTRERALRAECCSNLHQIGLALIQYTQDNQNLYPAVPGVVKASETAPGKAVKGDGVESLGLLYDEWIPDSRIFWCPTTPPKDGMNNSAVARPAVGQTNPSFRQHDLSSYAYDPRHQSTDPGAVALVADRGGGDGKNSPNHDGDGQNVLYNDAHAEWKKTTNVGYIDDEMFVRNDDLREKDSWLIE